MTPVWYIWLDDQIYFATGTDTQKFANLHHNQKVALALPDVDSVIILEGEAHAAERKITDKLGEYFYHKYEWDFRYDESVLTGRGPLGWILAQCSTTGPSIATADNWW